MNERIQQFAKEAGAYFGAASADYFGEQHPAFVNTGELDLEKFARLIIQESARAIENERKTYNPSEWDQGADYGHKNAIDAIKKQFGVNE